MVHGDGALPLVFDANGTSFIAATRFERGRVVVYGHEALILEPKRPDDRGRLLLNALRWGSGDQERLVVGHEGERPELDEFLSQHGHSPQVTDVGAPGAVQA